MVDFQWSRRSSNVFVNSTDYRRDQDVAEMYQRLEDILIEYDVIPVVKGVGVSCSHAVVVVDDVGQEAIYILVKGVAKREHARPFSYNAA